jgi:hypothetical protein
MRAPIPYRNNTTRRPGPGLPAFSSPCKTQLPRIIIVGGVRYICNEQLVRSHCGYGKSLRGSESYGFDGPDVVPIVEGGGGVGAIVDVDVEGGVPPLERRLAGCEERGGVPAG